MWLNILKVSLICYAASLALADQMNETEIIVKAVDDKWYHFSTDKLNWFGAFAKCREMGGLLATLDRETDQTALSHYMLYNSPNNSSYSKKLWWVSATDLHFEGSFAWFSKGTHINFGDWASNQPNNLNKNQHCVQLRYTKNIVKKYQYDDVPCENKANYICEWYD